MKIEKVEGGIKVSVPAGPYAEEDYDPADGKTYVSEIVPAAEFKSAAGAVLPKPKAEPKADKK